jgi:hypothetical protein
VRNRGTEKCFSEILCRK